jgi:hypothetical protein
MNVPCRVVMAPRLLALVVVTMGSSPVVASMMMAAMLRLLWRRRCSGRWRRTRARLSLAARRAGAREQAPASKKADSGQTTRHGRSIDGQAPRLKHW